MAKKENIEGYKVIVFCPVHDASDYWGHAKITPAIAERTAGEVRDAIKRHLSHDFSRVIDRHIDVEVQSQAVCEHCGNWWTEKEETYNGGCCDEDEKANPDAQVAA